MLVAILPRYCFRLLVSKLKIFDEFFFFLFWGGENVQFDFYNGCVGYVLVF